jgi:hypothetical protein
MNLPIKFPSDAEVIIGEVTHFRALSPEERIRSIRGILETGVLIMRESPKQPSCESIWRNRSVSRSKR